jgi:hypothetical protein
VDRRVRGKLSAASMFFALLLAVRAWAVRVPVSTITMRPNPGFWMLVLEAALTGVFLLGLESVLIGLPPMRFLEGSKIKEWSRPVWLVLLWTALFAFVLILLQPGSGYIGKSETPAIVPIVTLFAGACLFSILFWAYFRYRKPRMASERV